MSDTKGNSSGGRRNRRHNRNRRRQQPPSSGDSSPGSSPGIAISNIKSKINPLMSVKVDFQMRSNNQQHVTQPRQQPVGGTSFRQWNLPSPCDQQLGCQSPNGQHYYCERSVPQVGLVTAEHAQLPQPPAAYENPQVPQVASFCYDQSVLSDGKVVAPPSPTAANLQYIPPPQICNAVHGAQYNPVQCNVLPPSPQGPRMLIRTFYFYVGVKVYPPVFAEGFTNGPIPEPIVVWVPFPIFMYDNLPYVTYGQPDPEHVVRANPMGGNGPTLAAQQLRPANNDSGTGMQKKDEPVPALFNACPGGCSGCSGLRHSSTSSDSAP